MYYRYIVVIAVLIGMLNIYTHDSENARASAPSLKRSNRTLVDTGYIELCTSNCSFENGNMSGWTQVDGTFDVASVFVRSGSYSVNGTSATTAHFYRLFSLSSYTTQVDSGGGKVRASAFIDPGKSENGAVNIYFLNDAQSVISTGWESGWQYSPGTNWLEVANEVAIPVGTRYIKVAIYAKRSSGSYTDMNVDDVSTKVRFVYDAGTPTRTATSTITPSRTRTLSPTRTPTKTPTSTPQISSLSGVVRDATNNLVISGVTVCITQINRCSTTDSNGAYLITNIPPGSRTISASKSGYITYTDVLMLGASPTLSYDISMSPALAAGQMRIVLTWGQYPRDLDSHLWLPSNNGGYHVFFPTNNRGSSTAYPFAKLDTDDTDSWGPETITIYQRFSGTYTYAVHHYNDSGSNNIPLSQAKVRVYVGSQVRTFTPPPCPSGGTSCNTYKKYWTVFTINGANGQITTVNRYSDTSPRLAINVVPTPGK